MQKKIHKLLAALLVLAMVAGFVPALDLGIEAKAADVVATDVVFDYVYDISEYRSEGKTTFKANNYDAVQGNTAETVITEVYKKYPAKEGYVFAGWYADTQDMNPLGQDVTTGGAYAKYVPEQLIKAVAQVSTNTNHTTASSALRFIAAVDNLDYNQIGLTMTKIGGKNVYVHSSTKVYTSLSAAVEGGELKIGEEEVMNRFGAAANYMFALTLTGIKNQAQEYTAQPFWVTKDGTLVDHVPTSEKTVEMGVNANIAADKQTNPAPEGTDWFTTTGEMILDSQEDFLSFVEMSKTYDFKGRTIKLATDITFNEGIAVEKLMDNNAILEGVDAYTTIGSNSLPFAGTFDGCGHTISGIAERNTGYSGVFAAVKDATIKNLTVSRSIFRGGSGGGCSAAIAGKSYGTTTIENVNVTSDVRLYLASNMGGIVGLNDGNLTISNASSSVYINPQWASACFVGGIVGANTNTAGRTLTLENCLYNGSMVGTTAGDSFLGGLIGAAQPNPVTTLTDCVVSGSITTADNGGKGYFGSVIGSKSWTPANTVTTDVYATSESYSQLIRADQSFASGVTQVAEADITDGLALFNASELDYENVWTVTSVTPELKAFSTKADSAFYQSDKDELFIDNATELLLFAKLSQKTNFSGKTVKLTADITFNSGSDSSGWAGTAPSQVWTPIGSTSVPFAGTFDGQGHTISGLYYSKNVGNAVLGMFSVVEGATIKNLTVADSAMLSAAGSGSNGILVGTAYGVTVENVKIDSTVTVTGSTHTGTVAYAAGTNAVSFSNVWMAGTVTNGMYTARIGGLLGFTENTTGLSISVNNCLFTGTVSQTVASTTAENYVGGFVGATPSNVKLAVTDSLSAGTVTKAAGSTTYTGSVAGITSWRGADYTSFTDVYATSECYSVGTYRAETAYTGTISIVAKANLLGDLATGETGAPNLDYTSTWMTVEGGVPELVQSAAKNVDTSWYNDTDTEFVITTAAQLNGFAELCDTNTFAGKTIKLGANITYNTGDAAAWVTAAPANVWTASQSTVNSFQGIFDGQGYTISGLYSKVSSGNAAFIGHIKNATVKNLRVVNSYFESTNPYVNDNTSYHDSCGIIGRANNCTVSNVYTDAILVGGCQMGIVAFMDGALTMDRCWFDGTANLSTTYRNVFGGMCGNTSSKALTTTNCLFTGTVTGGYINESNGFYSSQVGGLSCGYGWSAVKTMKNCLIAGDFSGAVGHVAHIANISHQGFPSATYAARTNVYVVGDENTVLLTNPNNGVDGGSYVTTGTAAGVTVVTADAITGDAATTGAPNLDYLVTWAINEGDVPTPTGATYDDMDLSWYGDGSATTFTLYDADDLYGFAYMAAKTNFSGKTVLLGADIVVNEGDAADWAEEAPARAWTSIGSTSLSFLGTFDGQDHTISGLYQNGSVVGLFGDVSKGGKVQNLKLLNSYFEGTGTMAAIAAYSTGSTSSFTNIYTDAILVGANQVGGIIGRSYGTATTNITGCTFAGSISAKQYGAGFVGIVQNAGTITIADSAFTGSVTVTAQDGAGFVGMVSANQASKITINNSTSSGTVTGPMSGGFIGRIAAHSGTAAHSINNSTFSGKVTTTGSAVAGFVGYTQANLTIDGSAFEGTVSAASNAAGFVGQALSTLQITNATAIGSVTATGNNAAALVAYNTGAVAVEDSTVSTVVSAANYSAGYVGKVDANVTISGSTFDGNVKATTSYAGGYVGYVDNSSTTTISNSQAHGTVTVGTSGAAGFVGFVEKGTANLSNCWSNTTATAGNNVGGLVGRFNTNGNGSFTDCVATGAIICNGWGNNGQFIGNSNVALTATNCYWASNADSVCEASAPDKAFAGSYPASGVVKVSSPQAIVALYKAGEMPDVATFLASEADSTFTISTKADLYAFAYAARTNNFSGKTVKLANDITLNDEATYGEASTWDVTAPKYGWQPIGHSEKAFAGTFDGQGNTISGVYCEYAGGNGMGLFSFVSGTIKDFRLENSYFENTVSSNYGYNAAVAGYLSGTASQIYTNAVVKAVDSWTGGIAGMVAGASTITECQFDGRLMARCNLVGGCTNVIDGKAMNEFAGDGNNSGRGHAAFIGGIAGCLKGTSVDINNCHFTGHIYNECQNAHRTGGIMGGINAGTATITKCISAGNFYTANLLANSGNSYHFNMIMDCRGLGGLPTNAATLFNDNYVMDTVLYDIRGNEKNAGSSVTGATSCGVSTIRYTEEALVAKLEADLAAGTNNLDYTSIWYYNVGKTPTLRFGDVQSETSTYYITEEDGSKILMMGMSGETNDTYVDMNIVETEYTGDTYSLDADGDGTNETYNCLYLEQVNEEAVPFKDIFYGDGTYLTKYVSTTKADADKLISDMVAYGFDVYATSNLNDDCYYTAMTFGNNVYAVTFFATTGETYVSASNEQKLSPYMNSEYYKTAVNIEGGEPYGDASGNAYSNVTITSVSLVNGGDAFVIRLKNGHYIVIDGGTNNQTDRNAIAAALGAETRVASYETDENGEYVLNEKGEKIVASYESPQVVVDAWIFTHAHADHAGLFRGGIWGPIQTDVYIKGFYFNFSQKWHSEQKINIGSDSVDGYVNLAYAYVNQDDNGKNYYMKGYGDTSDWWVYRTATSKTASNVNNPTWDGASTDQDIPIYRVQAGQKFYFDGMTVEVPYTQEQVQPSELNLDLNGTCSWFLLTYQKEDGTDGSTFLDAGDAERFNAEAVAELYSADYKIFGADIGKTFHHGLNPLVKYTGDGSTPSSSTINDYDYTLVDKFYGINTSYGDGKQTKFAFITKPAGTWLQVSGYNNNAGSQRDLSIHEMRYLFGYNLGSWATTVEAYKTITAPIPFAAYGGEFSSSGYTDTFEGTTTVTMTSGGVTWDKYHTTKVYYQDGTAIY